MRVLAGILLMVGCTQPPEQKAQDVCQAYCDCSNPAGLPAVQTMCIEQQCLPSLPPVSDACLDCVYAHDQTCSALIDQCTNDCFSFQTPHLGGMR